MNNPNQKIHRIGIFGGSFNPFHKGHLNSVLSVATKKHLEKVLIIPAHQTPHKTFIENPSPKQRLKIAQLGCSEYTDILQVDSREVNRQDISYTITTLKELNTNNTQLFLIIGLDLFYSLDHWKEYKDILKISNLLVTSRPHFFFPESIEEFPKGLQDDVKSFSLQKVELSSGKTIEFIQIDQDVDISSTRLRRKIQNNKSTYHYLDVQVEEYIKENKLYQEQRSKGDLQQIVTFAQKVLDEQKAMNIKAFHLSSRSTIAEHILIASGMSRRHTQSLSDILIQRIKDEFSIGPMGVEGMTEGHWVAIDYSFFIVHIFYHYIRDKYQLESLFSSQ